MANKKSDTAKNPISKFVSNMKTKQQRGAQEQLLEDLFNNMYRERKKIYKMNFIRGIFLGVGTAIGGTIVVALIIWLLSLFVNFPLIGEYFENAQQTIDQSEPRN